jgi:hypothetical protein
VLATLCFCVHRRTRVSGTSSCGRTRPASTPGISMPRTRYHSLPFLIPPLPRPGCACLQRLLLLSAVAPVCGLLLPSTSCRPARFSAQRILCVPSPGPHRPIGFCPAAGEREHSGRGAGLSGPGHLAGRPAPRAPLPCLRPIHRRRAHAAAPLVAPPALPSCLGRPGEASFLAQGRLPSPPLARRPVERSLRLIAE